MALVAPNLWETDGFRNRYAAEMVILLGCVDNNRTRQLCHEAFRQSEDLVYIDSGNGSYTGQVVCGVRRNRPYHAKAHRQRPSGNAEDHG